MAEEDKPAYINPLPVAVALVPVKRNGKTHLVTIHRNNTVKNGGIALPGGYVDNNRSGQQGASDELEQETGILIEPNKFKFYNEFSSHILQPKIPNSTLNLFYHVPKISFNIIDFEHKEKNGEVKKIGLTCLNNKKDGLVDENGNDITLCFKSHQQYALAFLQESEGNCFKKLRWWLKNIL